MAQDFQKQVLGTLEEMKNSIETLKKDVNYLTEYIEDSKLSENDKKALAEALKEERDGKLLSKKQVFG